MCAPIARLAVAAGDDGIVYAVDINRELLDHIERTASEQGLGNLRIVLAANDDPQLPEPVGLVFICDTLHHIEQPDAYLKVAYFNFEERAIYCTVSIHSLRRVSFKTSS